MNRQEILNEINKTKEHLANMEKMLEEHKDERWKPKPSEEYYCVDDGNDVRRVIFNIVDVYDRDWIKVKRLIGIMKNNLNILFVLIIIQARLS